MKIVYLLLLFTFNHKAFASTATIVFMDDYEPVSFLSKDKIHAIGVTPNIMSEIFEEESDQKLKLIGRPWIRAQEMVKKGEADAMVAVVTPERLSYSNASKVPAFYDAYRPFTYADHPQMKALTNIKSINDLKNFTLCEYLGSGWAKTYLVGKVKKIEYGRSIKMKVGMLASRRCDLIIDLGFLIRSTAKRNQLDTKIVELPAVFTRSAFHLMVSKKSPRQELLIIFDKKAKEMHENGRIEKIIQFWTPELQH